jgi:multidrug efflux pump
LLVSSASVLFYRGLPSELAPMEDQGTVMVFAIAPEGATLDYLNSYTKKIDEVFKSIPEMQRYMMIMGRPTVSNMISYTSLSSWHERERTSQQVAASIMPKLMAIPGIRAFAVTPQSLGGSSGGGMAINFVVQTSESYQKRDQHVAQILSQLANNPALMNTDSDLKLNKPELKVDVNRDKVAAVGASVVEIGRTLETMLGGRRSDAFQRNASVPRRYLQVADVNRRDPEDLTNIYVRGGNGEMIQLSNLVTVREDVAPRELNHFNKQRAAVISASVGDGHTLGQALDVLETTTRDVMGPAAQIDYVGGAREFKDSSSKIYVTFLLALAFIYLVLAAQFEASSHRSSS